ncbi:MAG TPA: hypothetical protein VEJ18_20940 [Planctomycetota bacterium]|nr:hypothetical protein [Planctomycetota bacterium]
MRKTVPLLFALAAGCLDLEQAYTLNPDGSGKVVVRSVFAPFSLQLGEREKSPEEGLLQAAREEITKAEGVDAWSEVSWARRPDGKSEFRGTAYFRDVSKLKLHNQGFSGFPGKAVLTKTADGGTELRVVPGDGEQPDKASDGPPLTDEQVKAKLPEERAKWQQGKAFLQGMMGELKVSARYVLPGPVTASTNLKKTGPSEVRIGIEGPALLKTLDGLMMDDAWLARQMKSRSDFSREGPKPDDDLNAALFGEKAPIRAVALAGKAAFDYEAEAAAAKAGMAAVMKKLDVPAAAAPAAPAQGGGLKSVQVVGAKVVRVADSKRGIRPLNTMEAGLTFSLLVEFPGSVLSVKEGQLEQALSDAGEDLLPKGRFDRSIHFPQLTEDRTGAVFDVNLRLPKPDAKGVKTLTGTLTYVVGGRTKDVDLGLGTWTAGAQGKELGASIGSVEETEIEVKLAAERDTIESLLFFDEQGKPLEARAAGSMWGGRSTTLTYRLGAKAPAKGRIVARVYDDLQSFKAAFAIQDVDLLGRPSR